MGQYQEGTSPNFVSNQHGGKKVKKIFKNQFFKEITKNMYHILRNEMKLQAESPKNSPPLCRAGEVWKFKKKFLRSRYTQYLLINTKSGSVNDVYKNFHNFVAIEQNPPSSFYNIDHVWVCYLLGFSFFLK